MTRDIRRGRLLPASAAPPDGERFETVLTYRNLVVEQILSSDQVTPEVYVQAQDEWVVVLAGGALLDVDGDEVALGPGDWVFLPAGVPHRVLRTEPATTWLAVHLHPDVPKYSARHRR